MNDQQVISKSSLTRDRMIQLLNDDLASEFQAVIATMVYSQVIEKSGYTEIARELELHAAGDFQHLKQLAKQIERLGGVPDVTRLAEQAGGEPAAACRIVTDRKPAKPKSYSYPLRRSAPIGAALSSSTLREIIVQPQGPAIDLAVALGIDGAPAKPVRATTKALKRTILSSRANSSAGRREASGRQQSTSH